MTHTSIREQPRSAKASRGVSPLQLATLIARGTVTLEDWNLTRVLRLANRVAPRPGPVTWVPGWHFGQAARKADELRSLREAIWRYFAADGREGAFVMKWYEGIRIRVHLGNDLSWALFVDGDFEPNQFAFLRSVLRRGMTFVDVGANDGLYALFAAKRVGRGGSVVALEPSVREYDRLQHNLMLNRSQHTRTIRAAAWKEDGEMTLRVAEAAHAGHNTLGQFVYQTASASEDRVPTVRLDGLIESWSIRPVDVLKVDAEGAETAVLQGATNLVRRDYPIVLLEVSDAQLRTLGSSQEELLGLLRGFGYALYVFDDTTGRPVPAERISTNDPNLLAIHPRHRR